jgi:hypothetical protein
MKISEGIRMGLRWVAGRPVETLLLVFGISLGIGATAAGLALAGRTDAEARANLASTRFREIVVTAEQSASDMDLPAVASTTANGIILTTADLAARGDAQDIQYGYIANRMDMRLGAFQMPGGSAQAGGPDGMQSPDNGTPPPDMAPDAGTAALPEGPQPVLEEINGFEVSPEFFNAWNITASQGSLFTTADMKKGEPLLVLGSRLAASLYEDGRPLGRQVLSRGKLYTIVGILSPMGTDYDGMAFTPTIMAELQGLDAMARMLPRFDTSLHFTVPDYSRLEQAKAQLESWFTGKYGAGTVVISVPRYAAETARDRNMRLFTIIVFLALSALVIAAVNVTNILASRAIRKRRAVGILKALGAGFSFLISRLMRETMGFADMSAGLLAVGVLAATFLVTALDVFPAMQAARAPAAEAIRYE